MSSLDAFVARAKSHNTTQHTHHATSLRTLTTSLSHSLTSLSTDLTESTTRVDTLAEGVEDATAEMTDALAPLEEDVCVPLAGLRERFVAAPMAEYEATGATPERTRYLFQTNIPRTAAREVLLAELAGEGAGVDDAEGGAEEQEEGGEEEDAEEAAAAPTAVPTRLTPSHHGVVLPDVTLTPVRSPARDGTPSRLREVCPNLGGVLSPPPVPSQIQEGEKMEGVVEGAVGKGKEKERESLLPMPMPMPLLKPGLGNTGSGGVAGGAKTRAGRLPKRLGGLLVADGAENVPPAAAMRSSTRRKSPRLR